MRMTQLGSTLPRVLLFNGAAGPWPYTKHQPKASWDCGCFPTFFFCQGCVPRLFHSTCPGLPTARTVLLLLGRQPCVPVKGSCWLFGVAQTQCSCPHPCHTVLLQPGPMLGSYPAPGLSCRGSLW